MEKELVKMGHATLMILYVKEFGDQVLGLNIGNVLLTMQGFIMM